MINFHGIDSYPTLESALFGAGELTKNADIDKYKYFAYGVGFEGHRLFSHPNGGTGRNVIIFGVDMISSTKTDNKKRHFNCCKSSYTRIRKTSLSAEKM